MALNIGLGSKTNDNKQDQPTVQIDLGESVSIDQPVEASSNGAAPTPIATAEVTDAVSDDGADGAAPRPRRRRSTRKPAEARDEKAQAAGSTPAEAEEPKPPAKTATRSRRTRATKADPADDAQAGDAAGLLKAINAQSDLIRRQLDLAEKHGKLLEQQLKAIEANSKKLDTHGNKLDIEAKELRELGKSIDSLQHGGGPGPAATKVRPKVGIFVDAANVELAADQYRIRIDWKKVLALLTRDRELARATVYSPVHEDLNVSIEAQRFVEPFLDSEYKIVTKPLKKFQDGTVKANVDIEMALDIVSMLDNLDVVCLVSGDGDFRPLVEAAQARGVRVEVIGVGPTVARGLKEAADIFIDLQERIKELRV